MESTIFLCLVQALNTWKIYTRHEITQVQLVNTIKRIRLILGSHQEETNQFKSWKFNRKQTGNIPVTQKGKDVTRNHSRSNTRVIQLHYTTILKELLNNLESTLLTNENNLKWSRWTL